MKLLNIVTENFKKLGTYSTPFKQGLNVISGDNARGKSTLLEAIKMALFGVAAVPGKKENIPTWGQSKVSVTLTFQLTDLDVYTLTRTLTTAKLTRTAINNEVILEANGHTPVTLRIEELTGLTIKDWELFIQSSQGSAAGILTFGAAALNRKVEEFAGVDLIDKIQSLAQTRASTIGARAEAKVVPESRLEELLADLRAAEADEVQAQQLLKDAQIAFDNLQPEPEPLTGQTAAAMRNGQRSVDSASVDVDKAEASVKHAKQRVADQEQRLVGRTELDSEALAAQLKELEAKGTELGNKDKAFKDVEQQAYSATETAASSLTFLEKAQADLKADATYALSAEHMQVDLAAAVEYIAATKADITRESELVGTAKATYDNLIKLADGATCPTCRRAKEDHDPVSLAQEAEAAKKYLEERRRYVAKLQDDLKVFENSKTLIDKNIATKARLQGLVDGLAIDHEAKHQKAVDLTAAVEASREEAISVYEQCQRTREQYAEVRAELKDAQAKNEALAEDLTAMRLLETELEVCEDHMADANKVLADLPDAATDAEVAAREKAEQARQELVQARILDEHNLRNAVGQAARALEVASDNEARSYKAREDALATNREAEADVLMAKRCERLVRFLRDRRQTYLKEVWDTVMSVSSALCNKSSSGLITRLDNRDGDFLFTEEGVSAPTISASGAQKALIGTSIRMGLSRALYGGDALMIFDEPTEGCTELNASNMVATLATSARQVLLITHRENDQSLAQHIINVG